MNKFKPEWRKRELAVCANCGAVFMAITSELKRDKGRTCSRSCAGSMQGPRDQNGERNPNWRGGLGIDPVLSLAAISSNKARYRALHRDRHLAHKAVQTAVARGDLVRQPCEVCGQASAHAHHHRGYENRLDVQWLCQQHHNAAHNH